jgi:hypothetical protein
MCVSCPGGGVGVGVGGLAALAKCTGEPSATIKSTIKANSDTNFFILPPSHRNGFTTWNHYCIFASPSQQIFSCYINFH